MGEVYLAQDTQLNRPVALKILPPHLASDEQRMRRFVQEANAASALNHPNIITIHEVGQADDIHFIATEFIDGVTLRHLMTRARMTLRETFDIIIQVASALTTAHAAGIVHRDIKPENIMLRSDGYVKVLDFGLAKLAEKTPSQRGSDPEAATKPLVNTDPGVVMGTVSYMSPEQARGLAIDARSDIWSFGVVLYEMIAGRMPFGGETRSDIIASILEREPKPLSIHSSGVPAELERITEKALAKDVEERYQTVKDLSIDLRRLKRQLDVEAELERIVKPEAASNAATDKKNQAADSTVIQSLANTAQVENAHTTSSAEYLFTEMKRHKKGLVALLVILMAVASFFVYLKFFQRTAIDSIVILPFDNQTKDPVIGQLCDGITYLVTKDLTKNFPGLTVMSSSTASRYKGQTGEAQKIGEALGARAVLVGTLSQSEGILIVETELINVSNGAQLWGERFKKDQTDIIGGTSFLSIQEEMAKQIFEKLQARLKSGG